MSRKEYQKQYYQKNKQKIDGQNRAYALKNKDTIREYHRNYANEYRASLRLTNPELLKKQNKRRYTKELDGFHYVYLLEDYNYVGVTNCLLFRFNNHKHRYNRDCTNHKILLKTEDRKEALELESNYHNMGYDGRHIQNSYR